MRANLTNITAFAVGGLLVAGGAMLLSRQMRRGAGSASNVVEWIDLDVPVSTAYNQWTQFEEFPRFMATVESVRHRVPAAVVKTPFFNPKRKTATPIV